MVTAALVQAREDVPTGDAEAIRRRMREILLSPTLDAALRAWADVQRAVTKEVEDLHRTVKDALASVGSGKNHTLFEVLAALPIHLFKKEHELHTGKPDLADKYDLPVLIVKEDQLVQQDAKKAAKFSFYKHSHMWYMNAKRAALKDTYKAQGHATVPEGVMAHRLVQWEAVYQRRKPQIDREFADARDAARLAWEEKCRTPCLAIADDPGRSDGGSRSGASSQRALPLADSQGGAGSQQAPSTQGSSSGAVLEVSGGNGELACMHQPTASETLATWDEEGYGVCGVGSRCWTLAPLNLRNYSKDYGKRGGTRSLAERIKEAIEWYVPAAAEGPAEFKALAVNNPCREMHPGWCKTLHNAGPPMAKEFWKFLHELEPHRPRRVKKGESRWDDTYDDSLVKGSAVVTFALPGEMWTSLMTFWILCLQRRSPPVGIWLGLQSDVAVAELASGPQNTLENRLCWPLLDGERLPFRTSYQLALLYCAGRCTSRSDGVIRIMKYSWTARLRIDLGNVDKEVKPGRLSRVTAELQRARGEAEKPLSAVTPANGVYAALEHAARNQQRSVARGAAPPSSRPDPQPRPRQPLHDEGEEERPDVEIPDDEKSDSDADEWRGVHRGDTASGGDAPPDKDQDQDEPDPDREGSDGGQSDRDQDGVEGNRPEPPEPEPGALRATGAETTPLYRLVTDEHTCRDDFQQALHWHLPEKCKRGLAPKVTACWRAFDLSRLQGIDAGKGEVVRSQICSQCIDGRWDLDVPSWFPPRRSLAAALAATSTTAGSMGTPDEGGHAGRRTQVWK